MNAKVWVKWREYIQGKKTPEILIFEKLKTKMFVFFLFLPEMINYLNPAT